MKLDDIKGHWSNWANTYGADLRATTKTSTAKAMELDALGRAFDRLIASGVDLKKVLEIGCGNGHNCLYLSERFKNINFKGLDFIPEMVDAANAGKLEHGIDDNRLQFAVGNVMELDEADKTYDVIFSDRCLINLNSDDLQKQAITSLCSCLKTGGHLLMIENSQQTYARQNKARQQVGLDPRIPSEFNYFFDEDVILPHLETLGLHVLDVEDFISLHDLMLYVFVPLISNGDVDYDHPLVKAATDLNIAVSQDQQSAFGAFGQNRLYFCKKV